ncbi:MAG: endonuclease III [Candidatus Velamenicoccus archaeovorus]
MAIDARRLRAIHRRLLAHYGGLDPPRRSDPLEELILTVLSQHTSDVNAERAYAGLRRRFAGWGDVVAARRKAVADAIRSGGLADTKAPRIQAILREIHAREGAYDLSALRDEPDRAVREYLTSLPGVGVKTAAVVMAFSLGRAALPVDTHVHRVARRLGLVPERASAERAHARLEALAPSEIRVALHVGLIRLGREICRPGRPRCEVCPLRDVCPSAARFLEAAEARPRGGGRPAFRLAGSP